MSGVRLSVGFGSIRQAKGNHNIAQREIEQFVSTSGNGDTLLPVHRIRHGRSIHPGPCVFMLGVMCLLRQE